METIGYVYCLSNESMPNLVKVGEIHTDGKTPKDRARELFTTGVPAPFKVEFAKKVKNPKQKEITLHKLLEEFTERYSSRREFFQVTPKVVLSFFDLMDGEMWNETPKKEENDEEENDEEENDEEEDDTNVKKLKKVIGCRDMSKCFTNGQRIRHTIGINKEIIGVYDSTQNGILYNEKILSLNKFAMTHLELEETLRKSVNAWYECECDVNGEWVSTYNL